MMKFSSKFTSKPSYDLYFQLWYILDIYLPRINDNIYLNYYKWNLLTISEIKKLNINDVNKLKMIYEYDYKVFKVLLFLYWDLEYYLEGYDLVQDIFKIDLDNDKLFNIMYKNKVRSNSVFLNKIKTKKPINLWTNLEIRGMFDKILKYDVYTKIDSLDTRHKKAAYIKEYKLYKKYNDLMNDGDIYTSRLIQSILNTIEAVYYKDYIKGWYEEWKSEINKDLNVKYKEKIRDLDLELSNLIKNLEKTN